MQNLVLNSIWEATRSGNTYVYPNSHTYYELVYYPHGNGITTIDGVAYPFHPNTFVIIPPNVKHDEARHTDSTILCLSFSCDSAALEICHHVDDSKVIYKVLKDILKESMHQAFGYQDMITAKLNELFIRISRLNNKSVTSKNFEYITNYLKENYYEKIQLSDCAKQLNISYDYFQHKFKQLTGLSPQNFLLEQRLNAAKELLLYDNCNCTEIAYRCGFSTSAQFSMLFKKKYGVSPQKYKAGVGL